MATTAQFIIDRVSRALHDVAHTRWPKEEKLLFLNMAITQVIMTDPSSNSKYVNLTSKKGAKQTLAPNHIKLLTITRNVKDDDSWGRAVGMSERSDFDAQLATWTSDYTTDEIESYTYDSRIPKTFFCYPPPSDDDIITVEAMVTEKPADVALSDVIPLPDTYISALIHWMIYLCLSFNMDSVVSNQVAQLHYSAFYTELGVEKSSSDSTDPNTKEAY